MSQTLVTKLSNSVVYLIGDDNISYFLSLPNSSTSKINICINISSNLNNNTASDIARKCDNQNMCIISPLFSDNVLMGLENNNEEMFMYVDKIISYLINSVYKVIISNKMLVDNDIVLFENNSYKGFNNWFMDKYKDRVKLIKNEVNTGGFKPVELGSFASNVGENKPVDEISSQKARDVLENTQTIVTNRGMNEDYSEEKDLGFVSYILLGVLVAVGALTILYLLI